MNTGAQEQDALLLFNMFCNDINELGPVLLWLGWGLSLDYLRQAKRSPVFAGDYYVFTASGIINKFRKADLRFLQIDFRHDNSHRVDRNAGNVRGGVKTKQKSFYS